MKVPNPSGAPLLAPFRDVGNLPEVKFHPGVPRSWRVFCDKGGELRP
jgi:hypothetical protein